MQCNVAVTSQWHIYAYQQTQPIPHEHTPHHYGITNNMHSILLIIRIHKVYTIPEAYHQPGTTTHWPTPHCQSCCSSISNLTSLDEVLCLVSTGTPWWVFCSDSLCKLRNAKLDIPLIPSALNVDVVWTSVMCLLSQTILASGYDHSEPLVGHCAVHGG